MPVPLGYGVWTKAIAGEAIRKVALEPITVDQSECEWDGIKELINMSEDYSARSARRRTEMLVILHVW